MAVRVSHRMGNSNPSRVSNRSTALNSQLTARHHYNSSTLAIRLRVDYSSKRQDTLLNLNKRVISSNNQAFQDINSRNPRAFSNSRSLQVISPSRRRSSLDIKQLDFNSLLSRMVSRTRPRNRKCRSQRGCRVRIWRTPSVPPRLQRSHHHNLKEPPAAEYRTFGSPSSPLPTKRSSNSFSRARPMAREP